jgi:hypothetical protein
VPKVTLRNAAALPIPNRTHSHAAVRLAHMPMSGEASSRARLTNHRVNYRAEESCRSGIPDWPGAGTQGLEGTWRYLRHDRDLLERVPSLVPGTGPCGKTTTRRALRR